MTKITTERVYFNSPNISEEGWWQQYRKTLSALSPTAREVLKEDCSFITHKGIFGAGRPDTENWPANRTRTGLVMGSVQSGKTASMFGVTALALDEGIDIVVILAGTRLSLWRQTYERFMEQLDTGPDNADKIKRRLLSPSPQVALDPVTASLQDTYRISSASVRRKLTQRQPVIVIAMKQTNHLYALGKSLRDNVFATVRGLQRPIHMLVLDDEADDGSVLDATVEAELDPLSPLLKQVPRSIADLWEPRSGNAPQNLFATYIGYTATPQANLLQQDHNPLAPRDFVISLRTPLDTGGPVRIDDSTVRRSSTYIEPTGINNFYTGGEVFYNRNFSARLCLETSGEYIEELGNAVRSFLVASAIRLYRSRNATGPQTISKTDFESREALLSVSPDPASMLFHPSADIEDHFTGAEDILLWAGVPSRSFARTMIKEGSSFLPTSLISKMRTEEPLWEKWLKEYTRSSIEVATEFNLLQAHEIPSWLVIRDLLEREVIPATRVSVVNSDPNSDDRPEYKPRFDSVTQRWYSARDLSTIFVSGNVMARGLTLEGLTTTFFQRRSKNPLADTQMQMQRWFGYRGSYIELCRVFADREQLDLFASYHDVDEALRNGIAARMIGDAPSPVVLQGLGFQATGKIANLSRVPLCPSSKPFTTIVNGGNTPDRNMEVVAKLFASNSSSDVIVNSVIRGRALDKTLSLAEAAKVLDSLVYDRYRPGKEHQLGELWAQVQARVAGAFDLPIGTVFYNPATPVEGKPTVARRNCPYAVPAYLRLWEACLERPVRGLFVTGVPSGRWSMSDLELKNANQPRFTVGIRYGSGQPVTTGPLSNLDFQILATTKRIGPNGDLETTWGANDPDAGPSQYKGDEFFDYYHRLEKLPTIDAGTPWRPEGSHGQILFYINQLPGQAFPSVGVGVCIPGGGPEQFAAIRSVSSLGN